MTWTITLPNEKCERITCSGIQLSPDGGLICINGSPQGPNEIVAIYNQSHWIKVEPSSIQVVQ